MHTGSDQLLLRFNCALEIGKDGNEMVLWIEDSQLSLGTAEERGQSAHGVNGHWTHAPHRLLRQFRVHSLCSIDAGRTIREHHRRSGDASDYQVCFVDKKK